MKIIECPRDAMQGLPGFIPTLDKARYLNALLKVGFDTLDFGSFVSPKAIPQMRDTAEVLDLLDLGNSRSHLLAIVANVRGAEASLKFPAIQYLGFPLSVSETFQQRNTRKSIGEAVGVVRQVQELCAENGKRLVVYLSMGFGNPYGDPYSPEMLPDFTGQLVAMGVQTISLSDTVGTATPGLIGEVFATMTRAFPDVELGAHLHAHPDDATEKVLAAIEGGCRRVDGALGGLGGCPMADDQLIGNMPTETILAVLKGQGISHHLDLAALAEAQAIRQEIMP